ncbi:MAG: hypothetical protein RR397_10490 [Odoribacter sp.]
MDNFIQYRLNDWRWVDIYKQQLGREAFDMYQDRVCRALLGLRENEYYDIAKQVKVANRDLFIKTCCQFILTHNDYEFSNDYTKIIHRECLIFTKDTGRLTKKNS